MAQPIGMKTYLISLGSPYSVENGAFNRNAGVFSFDIHLNMARPIETKVCLGCIVNWSLRTLSLSLSEVTQNTLIFEANCTLFIRS